MDTGLQAGSVVRVGSSVELEVLDTPGHTMSHICLLSRTQVPALFSGDTIFNAGVGHCHYGGDPEVLADTVFSQVDALPDNTMLYPGHDYIVNNLRFTLDREPNNRAAAELLQQVESQDPNQALITNLGQERQINSFFRTQSPEIIEHFPQLSAEASPREVFLALRECRNSW
jgi:hydroxyacylglutathione hydrolase